MKSVKGNSIISIRPGKAVSTGSLIGLIFMILFGAGFTVVVTNVLFANDAPLGVTILFFIFMIGWMGAAIFMLVYHWLNLKRAHGVPLFEVEVAKGFAEEATAQDPAGRPRSHDDVNK
jgi:hypothetical protein